MTFSILSENLQKKLSFVIHAVSQRSQLPVLLNLLLETKNGKLYISATDLEIGIQVEIPANIEEEGATTVPAKTFYEAINSLPTGKIIFQTEKNELKISSLKIKSTFQTIPKDEFPKLYEEKGEKLTTIKKEALQKDFARVVFAAALDLGRPALSGVLIKKDTDGGFLLVATDGYRLSLKHQAQIVTKKTKKDKEESEKPLLIPARVLREATLIKEEGDVDVFISEKSNQILLEQNGTILVGRLIDAEFPNYEKIIPTDFATRFFFDKEELQKAVKMCAIFARDSANIVRLSVKKDAVTVSANTPSVGENTVEVEAKIEGEENEIAFNARYLLDLFGNLEEEEMVFEMIGPLSPGVFKIKGDSSFLHLIMPIRVQQ